VICDFSGTAVGSGTSVTGTEVGWTTCPPVVGTTAGAVVAVPHADDRIPTITKIANTVNHLDFLYIVFFSFQF
jgi:hypothetical protein